MPINRATDEKHLAWLRLRSDGASCRKIARLWGVTDAAVVTSTNKALAADLSESGEPEQDVRREYW